MDKVWIVQVLNYRYEVTIDSVHSTKEKAEKRKQHLNEDFFAVDTLSKAFILGMKLDDK